MYRRIVMLNGKRILLCSIKNTVIQCFDYSMKYFVITDIKVNKKTWTIKFKNELYNYTFVLPKEIAKKYINNEI